MKPNDDVAKRYFAEFAHELGFFGPVFGCEKKDTKKSIDFFQFDHDEQYASAKCLSIIMTLTIIFYAGVLYMVIE